MTDRGEKNKELAIQNKWILFEKPNYRVLISTFVKLDKIVCPLMRYQTWNASNIKHFH